MIFLENFIWIKYENNYSKIGWINIFILLWKIFVFCGKQLSTINKTIYEEDCSKQKNLDAYSLEILNSFYKLREKN